MTVPADDGVVDARALAVAERNAFCAGVLRTVNHSAGATRDAGGVPRLGGEDGWARVERWVSCDPPTLTGVYLLLREVDSQAEHVVNGAAVEQACDTINSTAVAGMTPPLRREILFAYFAREPERIGPDAALAIVQVAVYGEVAHATTGERN